MAWYPLPRPGDTVPSAGDEFFETQSVGWSLWSFGASDDDDTPTGVRSSDLKQDHGAGTAGGRSSEEEQCHQGPAAPPTSDADPRLSPDTFLPQFSDEEMRRRMDDDDPLDMFPDDSMCRLLSYESMLTGVLAGSVVLTGDDAMDTCGSPLFSHDDDLQNGSGNVEQSGPEMMMEVAGTSSENDKAELGVMKRSRPAIAESTRGFEAFVLEEFEDVVSQLTKRTRTCYRDAFYRLANESSKAATCSAANGGATEVSTTSSKPSFQQQVDDDKSRVASTPGCHERETNAVDRVVMVLTMKPPRQLHGNCCVDEKIAEARSTVSWSMVI